jgi:hypothetical protein
VGGGRCSRSDSNVVLSFRRLKIFEEGAPVGRWVSWSLGRSSDIATRTGSRGRLGVSEVRRSRSERQAVRRALGGAS